MSNILIVGAGTMGCGFAQVFSQGGHTVLIHDIDEKIMQSAMEKIKTSVKKLASKGLLNESEECILNKISMMKDIQKGADIDLLIEAIIENLEAKKGLFRNLSGLFPEKTIFATNTSALSITDIAAASDRPDRFVGLHFFNPVVQMKLVEIVKGLQTSEETLQKAREFIQSIGKTGIDLKEKPGFLVNRVFVPMLNEAAFLLYEGVADAQSIDNAMKLAVNLPMGPLAVCDMIGIDVVLGAIEALHQGFGDSKYRPCPLLKQMVAAGFLGRKTGQGFYKY